MGGKVNSKETTRRPRHRWLDIMKMDLRNAGWNYMGCTDLAQDREEWRTLVNTVTNIWIPHNGGKFLSAFTICGFSHRAQLHEIIYLI
jgi:hypothetical protein